MNTDVRGVPQHGQFPYRFHLLVVGKLLTLTLRIQTDETVLKWRILIPFKLAKSVEAGDLGQAREIISPGFMRLMNSYILDAEQRFIAEPSKVVTFPQEEILFPGTLFQGQNQWGYRLEIDRGVAEFGIQKTDEVVEYFLSGGTWYQGRLVVSRLQKDEVTDQLTELDVRVLNKQTELWWLQTTKNQVPLMMRKPEIELPKEFSALPQYVREALPPKLHFWDSKGSRKQATAYLKKNFSFPRRRSTLSKLTVA